MYLLYAYYSITMLLKLTFREALPLARKLRSDLRPHTRDLKSHGRCFDDSHAVEWARDNADSDEEVAVGRLNELVEWGLLVHTADPFTRFEVGGTKTSYCRTVDAILDAELTSSTGPGSPESSESAGGRTAMTTALTFREAHFLARVLRADLAPHTRNRRHRFKSCRKCFRASRALEWARENIDPDEEAAVGRLNELVDLGLLVLVVHPSKRFEAGESRALYLRTVDSVLDAELTNVAT